jgi:hypothetical protein
MLPRGAGIALAFIAIGMTACGPDDREAVAPSFQTNEWCDTHPIECPDGIPDPNPAAPGYYVGANITAANCFSPSGAGITDFDKDGMADNCEQVLAQAFRPMLSLATPSFDCETKEPYWAVKYFPAKSSVVRIAYLFAYRKDCGTASFASKLLGALFNVITLNGAINNFARSFNIAISADDPGEGHTGDSEFALVDVRYNSDTGHWYLVRVKLSAHYGTPVDGSATVSASGVQHADLNPAGYPTIWIAKSKHANYVSRAACNAGRGPAGIAKDNCDANSPNVERLEHAASRNIGSLHQNALNTGTCVYSIQRDFYPGRECFWEKGNDFMGWAQYPVGHPPTPYYSILVAEFECYSYTGTTSWGCSDFGVVRP